jgi:hypothetical protein
MYSYLPRVQLKAEDETAEPSSKKDKLCNITYINQFLKMSVGFQEFW